MSEDGIAEQTKKPANEETKEAGPRSGLLSERLRAEYRSKPSRRWWRWVNRDEGLGSFLRWGGWLPFVVLEGMALYFLVSDSSLFGMSERASVLLPHGLACLSFPFALYPWLPPSYRESAWLSASLMLGISLTLPIFGPACVLIILKLLNKVSYCSVRKENPFWVVGSKVPDAEEIDFVAGRDASGSILQVMNGPDPVARRNLILATKRLLPEEAVPVLRAGLRDSDKEVKLYAQGILIQLVERYESGLADMKKSLEASPHDTVIMLRLAEQYCELVELGLVTDPELQVFYLKSPIELLEQVVEKDPQNTHVLVTLARYHLKVNGSDEALDLVERLRDLGMGAEVLEPIEIEALFQKRSWTEFRTRLREGLVNRFCDPRLQSLGDFWIEPATRATSSTSPLGDRVSAQSAS